MKGSPQDAQINPKKYRLLKSILRKLVVIANMHVCSSFLDKLNVDKNSLILLCKRLNIRGYSNKNKDALKELIVNFLKNQNKIQRSQSGSSLEPYNIDLKKSIRRTNSLPNINKLSSDISNVSKVQLFNDNEVTLMIKRYF